MFNKGLLLAALKTKEEEAEARALEEALEMGREKIEMDEDELEEDLEMDVCLSLSRKRVAPNVESPEKKEEKNKKRRLQQELASFSYSFAREVNERTELEKRQLYNMHVPAVIVMENFPEFIYPLTSLSAWFVIMARTCTQLNQRLKKMPANIYNHIIIDNPFIVRELCCLSTTSKEIGIWLVKQTATRELVRCMVQTIELQLLHRKCPAKILLPEKGQLKDDCNYKMDDRGFKVEIFVRSAMLVGWEDYSLPPKLKRTVMHIRCRSWFYWFCHTPLFNYNTVMSSIHFVIDDYNVLEVGHPSLREAKMLGDLRAILTQRMIFRQKPDSVSIKFLDHTFV